jgi:hypothetical protein
MTTLLSEEQLKQQIRVRVIQGRLPLANGAYTTQRGTGRPCIVCRREIDSSQIGCQVEGPGISLQAHMTCHHLWQEVSLNVGSESRRDSP